MKRIVLVYLRKEKLLKIRQVVNHIHKKECKIFQRK